MRVLLLGFIFAGVASAQDVTQLQSDVNSLKQIVAGQQAEISAKKTKVWTKSLPYGVEYGFGESAIIPSLRAPFVQQGKWYRVTLEGYLFATAEVRVIDGVPVIPPGIDSLPSNKMVVAIASSDEQVRDRYIASSVLWQAKSNEFNVFVWTKGTGGDNDGYLYGYTNDRTLTVTIEEVEVSVQPW